MAMYTFHICNEAGISISFEAFELQTDGISFEKAGELLEQHPSCEYVEVWREELPFLARYRNQPILRPITRAA